MSPVLNGRRFKTLNLSDEDHIFSEYTTMTELYNELKFITILYVIQKILRFNIGVFKVCEYNTVKGNRSTRSGEEIFEGYLPCKREAAVLVI